MELKIGIAQSQQVVEIELADDADRESLKKQIEQVVGSDDGSVLWVTDKRGKETAVPASRIAFVQLGGDDESRRIGFGA